MPPISRHEFLQRTAMAGAACLVSSIEGLATAQQKKIRVGVIGCGSVSNQYFPHLSRSPHVELVSACDIIYERATRQAAQYHVPHHYPHIDQMLAGPAFDLFVDLTDMQEHGRLNGQALACRAARLEREAAGQYVQGGSRAARVGWKQATPRLGRARRRQQPAVCLHGEDDSRRHAGTSIVRARAVRPPGSRPGRRSSMKRAAAACPTLASTTCPR